MAQLKSLIQKRNTVKKNINKIVKFLDELNLEDDCSKISVEQLDVKKSTTTTLHDNYNEVNDQILCIDESQEDDEDIFEIYQLILVQLETCRSKIVKTNVTESKIKSDSRSIKSSLPVLDIPTFDGSDVTQFNTFHELFDALIHKDQSLTNIQRLCYLKKYLKGEALELISSLPVVDASYNTAIDLVKERFSNTNVIINAHLKYLFEIPSISTGSSKLLREFISKIKQHVGCLKNLKEPVESWDSILVFLFSQKLDNYTIRAYNLEKNQKSRHNLHEFLSFLEKRAISMEASNTNNNGAKPKSRLSVNVATKIKEHPKSKKVNNDIVKGQCSYCNTSGHKIYSCIKFKNLPVTERIQFVEQKKLCKNCLREHTNNCTYKPCILCSSPHNGLLHTDDVTVPEHAIVQTTTSLSHVCTSKQVILPTAQILVRAADNSFVVARCLLDTGSQTSFVCKKLIDRLNISTFSTNLSISGISNMKTNILSSVRLELKSKINNFTFQEEFAVLPAITSELPQYFFKIENISIPNNIKLADDTFNKPSEIQILLGANIVFQLLVNGMIKLGINQPILQNTVLGYIISGTLIDNKIIKKGSSNAVTLHSVSNNEGDDSLNNLLTKFWEIENVPENQLLTENEVCETSFKTTVKRIQGRFQVQLPLRTDIKVLSLGDSYSIAIKRFLNLEKRFKSNPSLLLEYSKFINEYVELGHAKEFELTKYRLNNANAYFMAHHPVIRQDSTTTKLRVVFDGSMKTKNNISLSEIMYNGQIMQPELFDILILFRSYNYVFVADIKQMYRQILIHPEHKPLLNILWRANQNLPLKCLQLQTVTYGLKASPYLATRCLVELAQQEASQYPLAAKAIVTNCYIDDFLCGSNNLSETIKTRDELIKLLKTAHLELHKWCANHPDLLNSISKEHQLVDDIPISDSPQLIKTLGLTFDAKEDVFKISCPITQLDQKYTKRSILASVAKIYDPLGLVGPVILKAKLLLQKLWQANVSWDEELPNEIVGEWKNFASNLIKMSNIKINRNITLEHNYYCELIGYCDASNYAYGGCVYLRVICEDRVKVTLISSKSRVAPLRQKLTIPKLELNSGLLLAKLSARIYNLLKENVHKVILYSDSTISLAWIKSNTLKLNVYVANRVRQIQELTSNFHWTYVKSQDNPADCLSRGVDPQTINDNALWWNGPNYLKDKTFNHNLSPMLEIPNKLPETIAQLSVHQHDTSERFDVFYKYSSITRMRRIVAYCLRFIFNCKNKNKKSGNLKTEELQQSLIILLKDVQKNAFAETINALTSGKEVTSNLKTLVPFMDGDGLLRVGGRLENSFLNFSAKHPIILPQGSHITKLIINNEHISLLHAGAKCVLSNLRNKYWLLNGSRQVKKELHKCITCFRLKAKVAQQLMGSLPIDRVTKSRVFEKVGVDFGGPFLIKSSKLRKPILTKAYITLFVCFATKAIHLEVVSDMTTDTFLAALKRFIGRRGRPSTIYSDNGSTFKGANNKLKDLFKLMNTKEYKYKIENTATTLGINWSFIPSYSPVFGGLWEAGIKSVKYHLYRIVGNANLTLEQFNTILIEIEGILNSRPLCKMSDDVTDLAYLTPGHFLIGTKFTAIPEENITAVPSNRLKFWRECTKMQQLFWRAWSRDYLTQLQNRPKWYKVTPNIKNGTLVLIIDDNRPPLDWSLGRIIKVVAGKDGKVRVVDVKTKNNIMRTSISKIAILPLDNEE